MPTETQKLAIEYKQTEIGVIPEDWNVKELREIADFTNGKAHENFISDHGDYIVVNSKFISSEGEVAKYSNESFVPTKKDSILPTEETDPMSMIRKFPPSFINFVLE